MLSTRATKLHLESYKTIHTWDRHKEFLNDSTFHDDLKHVKAILMLFELYFYCILLLLFTCIILITFILMQKPRYCIYVIALINHVDLRFVTIHYRWLMLLKRSTKGHIVIKKLYLFHFFGQYRLLMLIER